MCRFSAASLHNRRACPSRLLCRAHKHVRRLTADVVVVADVKSANKHVWIDTNLHTQDASACAELVIAKGRTPTFWPTRDPKGIWRKVEESAAKMKKNYTTRLSLWHTRATRNWNMEGIHPKMRILHTCQLTEEGKTTPLASLSTQTGRSNP